MKFHQQLTFTQYHSIQIVSVIVKVSCTKKVKEGNSKVNVPKEISSAYSSVMCSAIQVLTLKEPGGGGAESAPPSTFFVISLPVVIFSR